MQQGARCLRDSEVMALVENKRILAYRLEAELETPERGVAIRRKMLACKLPHPSALENLPYTGYDYSKVQILLLLFSRSPNQPVHLFACLMNIDYCLVSN